MFTCRCQKGYTGAFCDVEINECHSNPCAYGGVCTDVINGYRCACPKGTTGRSDCYCSSQWPILQASWDLIPGLSISVGVSFSIKKNFNLIVVFPLALVTVTQ